MAIIDRDYQVVTTVIDDNGVNYNNTWYFKCEDANGTAADLYEAVEDDVIGPLQDILSVIADRATVKVINLFDDEDFFEANSATFTGGQVAGEAMPTFVGAAFRIVRPNRSIRHGRKTVGPLAEGSVANGSPTAGFTTIADSWALQLQTPIEADSSPVSSYALCIPKHTLVDEGTEDERYEITDLVVAQSFEFIRVSSQVSRRKY